MFSAESDRETVTTQRPYDGPEPTVTPNTIGFTIAFPSHTLGPRVPGTNIIYRVNIYAPGTNTLIVSADCLSTYDANGVSSTNELLFDELNTNTSYDYSVQVDYGN